MECSQKWLETETALVFVASAVTEYPSVQTQMDEIYTLDKFRYFDAARNSSAYNSIAMPEGRLENQVSVKRNLGIILVAEYDESIFQQIRKALILVHPMLRPYLSNPRKNHKFEEIVLNEVQNSSRGANKALSLLHITSYLLRRGNASEGIDSKLCNAATLFVERYSELEKQHYARSEKTHTIPRSTILEYFQMSGEDWKYIRSCLNAGFVNRLREEHRRGETLHRAGINPIPELNDYGDADELDELIRTASALCRTTTFAGVSWEALTKDFLITRDEQSGILAACHELARVSGGFRPHHYLIAFVVYALSKEISAMRDFYWHNNAETQFLENQHLLKENVLLKEQVSELKSNLSSEIALRDSVLHEERKKYSIAEHDLIAAHKESIGILSRTITNLEQQLVSQSLELDALRKIALFDETIEQPAVIDTSCLSAVEKNKIVIIGGHVNWRKKLQQEYPTLILLDGTSNMFDLKLLDTADVVFLYTYNMSHKVYDRVIAYTRQNCIQLAYLPRVTNTDLLMQQISQQLHTLLIPRDKLETQCE